MDHSNTVLGFCLPPPFTRNSLNVGIQVCARGGCGGGGGEREWQEDWRSGWRVGGRDRRMEGSGRRVGGCSVVR